MRRPLPGTYRVQFLLSDGSAVPHPVTIPFTIAEELEIAGSAQELDVHMRTARIGGRVTLDGAPPAGPFSYSLALLKDDEPEYSSITIHQGPTFETWGFLGEDYELLFEPYVSRGLHQEMRSVRLHTHTAVDFDLRTRALGGDVVVDSEAIRREGVDEWSLVVRPLHPARDKIEYRFSVDEPYEVELATGSYEVGIRVDTFGNLGSIQTNLGHRVADCIEIR